MSIFEEYYKEQTFIDRYLKEPEKAVDVIIPVYHTNELWKTNLFSIYREVPVYRLLISDGGCIDNSIDIVKQFPRVVVFDHKQYKTLGKCIAGLIEQVSTDWFIYLHSDVYLPSEWFDKMMKYKNQYDWYGCPMQITVLVAYQPDGSQRPYAGSQIGRKKAFEKNLNTIDDDYVYRQEDFVFNKIVEDAGYTTGKVEDAFHYHQVMYRKSSGYDLNIQAVNVITKTNDWEKARANEMQIKGIVKYLDPIEPYIINDFKDHAFWILFEKQMTYHELKEWIRNTNKKWLKFLNYRVLIRLNYHKFKMKARRGFSWD